MAERSIQQNLIELNSNQTEMLLGLLSQIDSILILAQDNLHTHQKLVIYDALCAVGYLLHEIRELCGSEWR